MFNPGPERAAARYADGQEGGIAALVELRLDRQGAEHIEAFERRALADSAVQQVWRVSPGPDFVLIVHCADMADYHALTKRLFRQKWNVRNVKTRFALRLTRASHARGKCRSRHRADALHRRTENNSARRCPPQIPATPRWAWPEFEQDAFDVAPWPVEPGQFASSDSRPWNACLRGSTHVAAVSAVPRALLEVQLPHFFVAEVRALAT